MEMTKDDIKIEPNTEQQNIVSEFFIKNIKHESTSDDPIITEFDEQIFLHNSSDQHYKESPDSDDHSNIDDDNENFVFVDEIVKEEPKFYDDSSNAEMFESTQDVTKNSIQRNWSTTTQKEDIDSLPGDDKKTLFKCQHCSECFQQEWIFIRHQKVHGVQKSFDCRLCSRKLASQFQLIAHERIHTNQKSLKQKKHKSLGKSECKRGRKAKTPVDPTEKMEPHIEPQPNEDKKTLYKCQHCSKTFEREWAFNRHQEVHGVQKTFDCNLCTRKFSKQSRLTAHQRIHTGQQPFECEICHRRFNHKSHVELHKRIHTGEKPYSCTQCNMRFRLKQHLDSHVKARSTDSTHHLLRQSACQRGGIAKNPIIPLEIMSEHSVEIRIFECFLCHIQCYKNDLRQHIRTIHCGEKVYSCKKCGKKVTTKYKMNQHIQTHSAKPKLQCQICGREFLRKDSLKQHIATHVRSYQCKFCPKKLSTEHILKTHLKTHTGLRPFQCDAKFCTKTFLKRGDMVRHKRIHTGERPYTCDVCKKSFTRNHTLTDHKEKMHDKKE